MVGWKGEQTLFLLGGKGRPGAKRLEFVSGFAGIECEGEVIRSCKKET